MRGLTGAGSSDQSFQAVSKAVVLLAALGLFLTACATGGTGARDEGPAHVGAGAGAGTAPSAQPSPSATPDRMDTVRLVRSDPRVSAAVKRELKPCVPDEYPVDVSYGDLTGGSADDLVVNVLTCGDAVGVGSYVYHRVDGRYENVFGAEESPVYAEIDRGDLVVTKQVYDEGDPVSNPSGEVVITYRWAGSRFAEEYRAHNEYGGAVGGGEPAPAPESN
ncbi:Lipoprotein CseA [Streptomyces sp. enrichment culture]|uniref:hypothetical protein n=1 Tax=Streptomyces sp. enrichment culture TaxID=1795815 RepID=UPI003F550DB6